MSNKNSVNKRTSDTFGHEIIRKTLHSVRVRTSDGQYVHGVLSSSFDHIRLTPRLSEAKCIHVLNFDNTEDTASIFDTPEIMNDQEKIREIRNRFGCGLSLVNTFRTKTMRTESMPGLNL